MLAGKRIVVTGGAGFVGSHLVRRLVRESAHVLAVLRPSTDAWRLQELQGQIKTIRRELRDLTRSDVEARLGEAHVVYHLAAAGVNQAFDDVPALIESNVVGTFHVLRLAQKLAVGRLVYVGSSVEYGSASLASEDRVPAPNSEYGATKAAGWALAHAFSRRHGLPVVSLRPFSVYGPLEAAYRLIPYCILRALDRSRIEVTAGKQTRDYVYVDDVMDAFVGAGVAPEALGGTFNVSTGTDTAVRDVVTAIVKLTESPVEPSFGVRQIGDTELLATSGNPAKAREVLSWAPKTSLEEGLAKTIEWFRLHRGDYDEYRN